MTFSFKHQVCGSANFAKGVVTTSILIIFYRLGLHVSLPFVDELALQDLFGKSYATSSNPTTISVFALGVMPYLSAYFLVEIFSLFVPFLRKLRSGDYEGRCKLRRLAFCMTTLFGIRQGHSLVRWMEGTKAPNGAIILPIESTYEYVILLAVLTVGVLSLIFVAELISKYGIGNGISIIILAETCAKFGHDLKRSVILYYDATGTGTYILVLLIFLILVFLAVLLLRAEIPMSLKHRLLEKPAAFFRLNACPSATAAIMFASSFLMLPVTLLHFFSNGDKYPEYLSPDSFIYNIVLAISVCLFSFLFAILFFHPKRRLKKMLRRGWQFLDNEEVASKNLCRKVSIYNIPWTALLCVLAVVPNIAIYWCDVPFYLGGAGLIVAVAISLDLVSRYAAQRRSPSSKFRKIAEFHDVYDAAMIKAHMHAEGILCHFQGYYHRHLLYFFGPYIDVSLMVPESDEESAKALLNKYYNGLGL